MSGRVSLTERFAKSATTEGRKSPISIDDEVIGFGLQVRDNGRKTFTLDYTFEPVPPLCRYVVDGDREWTARGRARRGAPAEARER